MKAIFDFCWLAAVVNFWVISSIWVFLGSACPISRLLNIVLNWSLVGVVRGGAGLLHVFLRRILIYRK